MTDPRQSSGLYTVHPEAVAAAVSALKAGPLAAVQATDETFEVWVRTALDAAVASGYLVTNAYLGSRIRALRENRDALA